MIKSFWNRAGTLWCTLMHASPMWPSRGYYRCSICLRTYPVLWAQNGSSRASQAASACKLTVPQRKSAVLPCFPVAFAGDRRRN